MSCHSVLPMFLKMNTRYQVHKPVKKCNYCGRFSRWSRGCVSVPNLVAIGLTIAEMWRFFDFLRWRSPLSWILKFLKFLTVERLKMVELRHCAKFGWNRCSSFDNMHVFRFHEFGLKTPIHAPKIGVLGGFDDLNGEPYQRNMKKAHPCGRATPLTCHIVNRHAHKSNTQS